MSGSKQRPDRNIQFDREKFLAAIHHIIEHCSDRPEVLGKTKLHKCLYYSDMLNFFITGEPLTGVDYIKAPYGPTARYLEWGLRELSSRGFISCEMEEYFGLGKYRYLSLRPTCSGGLTDREKGLLDEVTAFVCEHSAREISEFSHSQPWQDAQMGERIPYSSAYQLVPETAPTQADLDWASDQADSVMRYRRA